MINYTVPFYIFAFTFFEFIGISHLTRYDGSHDFITNNAQYLNDEISDNLEQGIGKLQYLQRPKMYSSEIKLRFEPSILDFRERPIGYAHSDTVTLYNLDNNKSLELLSISPTTVHFHNSFFADKTIPPKGNTSFRLVYLGRQEGPVESTLLVHTSLGFVKYKVKAVGTYNIYRIRPIVGVKIPINSTFSPTIELFNPHSRRIEILEIYSSGGGFQLELTSGRMEGPEDLWQISPYQRKSIIRVRFEAKVAQNHTAFIRIKINRVGEELIIPLEVEVIPQQTIFHPKGYVDFGLGGRMDQSKTVEFSLFNPLNTSVQITSVSTLSKSIKTQYRGESIESDTNKCVGTLTLDWENAWKTQDYNGKIIVKFANGQNRTEIPYFLTVIEGGLTYNKMITAYLIQDHKIEERKLEILNFYNQPVRILDVQYPSDVDLFFKVRKLTPLTIKTSDRVVVFTIRVRDSLTKPFTKYIQVLTNTSDVRVPVFSYDGKIQIHLPYKEDKKGLDLGLIGHHIKKRVYYALTNRNPVHVEVASVRTTLPMTDVIVQGCGFGDHSTTALQLGIFRDITQCEAIPPGGYAILKMTIKTTNIDRKVSGEIQIETPFQDISVSSIRFRIAYGKFVISQEELVFRDCFPYKLCEHLLIISSSFAEPMTIIRVVVVPNENKRIAKIPIDVILSSNISSEKNKLIGQLLLRPEVDCAPVCYIGEADDKDRFESILSQRNQVKSDSSRLRLLFDRFLNFTNQKLKYSENVTLRIETSLVKAQIFESKIEYVWPTLVKTTKMANNYVVQLPVAPVGNTSYGSFTIRNPSSQPVMLELVFARDYEDYQEIEKILRLEYSLIPEKKSLRCFHFNRTQLIHERKVFYNSHRYLYKSHTHNNSIPLVLKPSAKKRIHLIFKAEKAETYTSYLLIRNNLTVLEVVRVVGRGSTPTIIFTKYGYNDTKPLFVYNFTNSAMMNCLKIKDTSSSKVSVSNRTITQIYTVKNVGDVKIKIESFRINGHRCEGYGFKVHECGNFDLHPNGTRRIHIDFTTDLSVTFVERNLQIITDAKQDFTYVLYAVIPRSYCTACEDLLKRPYWEVYLNYIATSFLLVTLLVIFIVVLFEASAIKTVATDAFISSNTSPVLPVLDLKKIGNQVRDEIQTSEKEKKRKDDLQEGMPTSVSTGVQTTNNYPTTPTSSTSATTGSTTSTTTTTPEVVKIESAVVPTTGKAKKKLAQRISMNEDENGYETGDDQLVRARNRDKQTKKDLQYERHRLKSRERKTEKEMKLLEEKERKEKHSQQKESEARKRLFKQKLLKASAAAAATTTTTPVRAGVATTQDHADNNDRYSNMNENKERQWMPEKRHYSQSKVKDLSFSSTTYYSNDHKIKHVSFGDAPICTKPSKYQDKYNSDMDRMQNDKYNFSRNKEKKREFKIKERQGKLIYKNKIAMEKNLKSTTSLSLPSTSSSSSYEAGPSLLLEKSKSPIRFATHIETTPSTSTAVKSKDKNRNKPSPKTDMPIASSSSSSSSSTTSSKSTASLASKTESLIQNSTNKNTPLRKNVELLKTKPNVNNEVQELTLFEPTYNSIDLGPIGSKRLGTPGALDNISPTNKFKQEALLVNIKLLAKEKKSPTKEFNLMDDESVIAAVSNNTVIANSNNTIVSQNPENVQLVTPSKPPAALIDNGTATAAATATAEDTEILHNISPSSSKFWNRQPDLLKKLKPVTPETDSDDDSWEKPFNPNSDTNWTNAFSNVLNSSATWNNNSSYLWGLNPVWSWSPTHSSKKPPGFNKKEDKPNDAHSSTSYSPFGSGCSWAEKRDWDNKPDPNYPN